MKTNRDKHAEPKKKYMLEDFKRLQFSSKEKNLSQMIDEICYGKARNLDK